MNREQLNARAVELGAVAEEVEALETKADVQAVIDALAPAVAEEAPAVAEEAPAVAVVARGKGVACSRKGMLKAGAIVKPSYFTDPATFGVLCDRKILVSAKVYADQVKRAATNEDRED